MMQDALATLPPISLYQDVSSTNDLAMQGARQGAPHGSCWVADRQLQGRGRRQHDGQARSWFSPPAKNLYFSLLIKHSLPPELVSTLTLAAAVGAWRTLDPLLSPHQERLLVKWPNDLYIAHRKLGGILSEGVMLHNRLDAVIVGVGLNINLLEGDLPDDLRGAATSLAIATGLTTHDRLAITHALREQILLASEQLHRLGLPYIISQLAPIDQTLGRRLVIQSSGQQGTSRGISASGGLRVELDDGQVLDVQTGEVSFASSPQEGRTP